MLHWFKKQKKEPLEKIDDTPKGPRNALLTMEKYNTIKHKYWVNSKETDFDASVWCFWKFGAKPPKRSGNWRNPTFTEALHRQYMWHSNYEFYIACTEDSPCTFRKRTV